MEVLPKPRHRAYVALAVGTVALAVGVNLVVFTIVNSLWLRPLPFPDADRFVVLSAPFVGIEGSPLQPFQGGVAGQVDEQRLGLRPQVTIDRGRAALEVAGVTPGFFRLFGLSIRGRDFTLDDNAPGAEPVAIVSHRVWQRDLGGRTDVAGTVISSGATSIRVIGVAPPGFEGVRRGDRIDVWMPSDLRRRLSPTSLDLWGVPFLVFARLPAGRTAGDVEQLVNELAPQRDARIGLMPLASVFGTPTSPTVIIGEGRAMAVAGGLALLVLIGGCATLATLILVHYERRSQELATKAALGATRGRLIRELSRELAVVAVLGALGAMFIAHLALRAMPAINLSGGLDLGRLDLSLDWRVLGAAIAATLATCTAAAWLPLSRFTRSRLAGELLAGPGATASVASQRLRQLLLAAQVAAAVVVLASAALFVRAVLYGFGHASGIDVDHTAFVRVEVVSGYGNANHDLATWIAMARHRKAQIRQAIQSLPGVEHVVEGPSPIGSEPMANLQWPMAVELDSRQHEMRVGRINTAEADWLSTLGVPILAGRGLTAADGTARPMPAVVTASLAQRLWPGESPLGQIIDRPSRSGPLHIVGVAADFVYGSLLQPAAGSLVTAWHLDAGGYWVIRAAHPATVVTELPRAVRSAVADVASIRVMTGREVVAQDLGRERAGAWFFSGFGLVALILGVGSVFGLVAYLAESRRREFGVRLALGATASSLVRHGVRAALVPVAIGVAFGVLLAALVARVFSSVLIGVAALDPLAYSAIAVAMLSGAMLAAIGAAWRLRRIAPMDALQTR